VRVEKRKRTPFPVNPHGEKQSREKLVHAARPLGGA
jgi:hypothetical protein